MPNSGAAHVGAGCSISRTTGEKGSAKPSGSLSFKGLEHGGIEKVDRVFRDML